MANTLIQDFRTANDITVSAMIAEVAYIKELAPAEDPDLTNVKRSGWEKCLQAFRAMGIDPSRYSLQEGVTVHFDSLKRAYLCASIAHLLRISSAGDDPYSATAAMYEKSFQASVNSVKVVEETESAEIENQTTFGRLTR